MLFSLMVLFCVKVLLEEENWYTDHLVSLHTYYAKKEELTMLYEIDFSYINLLIYLQNLAVIAVKLSLQEFRVTTFT